MEQSKYLLFTHTIYHLYSLNWVHVLSVDITHDVAHLHCHQGDKQDESELVMIGYNGIAYPSLKFTQVLVISLLFIIRYCSQLPCCLSWMHWKMAYIHWDV